MERQSNKSVLSSESESVPNYDPQSDSSDSNNENGESLVAIQPRLNSGGYRIPAIPEIPNNPRALQSFDQFQLNTAYNRAMAAYWNLEQEYAEDQDVVRNDNLMGESVVFVNRFKDYRGETFHPPGDWEHPLIKALKLTYSY